MSNKIVTIIFGICFALGLFAASRAQQIGGSTGGAGASNSCGSGSTSCTVPAGNATNPAIIFTGSATNTGFAAYQAANLLSVVISGTESMRFASSSTAFFGDLTGFNNGALTTSGAVNDSHADFQTPSTGFTITIAGSTYNQVLAPAGTLATGTLTMPASPSNGTMIRAISTQTITALTVSPNSGQSILGNPTTLAAGGHFFCIYRTSNTTWYC